MYEFARKRIRITAAERRESVAPGASPGLCVVKRVSTGGAKDFKDCFAPTGLEIQNDTYPGLAPGASLSRRSAAVIRMRFARYIDRRYSIQSAVLDPLGGLMLLLAAAARFEISR